MKDAIIFSCALCAVAILSEIIALKLWRQRWRTRVCTIIASVITGIIGTIFLAALSWTNYGWKPAKELFNSNDGFVVCLFILMDGIIVSFMALVPAGFVAFIYKRLDKKKELLSSKVSETAQKPTPPQNSR